jgi:iron complex transport system substrate-binding protein
MHRPIRFLIALFVLVALVACGSAPAAQTPTEAPAEPTEAPAEPTEAPAEPTEAPAEVVAVIEPPAENLSDGCVTDYDPEIDYFPEKATISDSVGWTIEYFNNYKLITVLNPWTGAEQQFSYALVQCGTPAPADLGNDTQVIEVPVQSVVSMSSTNLPHLNDLGVLDRLVGVDNFMFVNTPAVVERIEAGDLVEIGSGAGLNVEQAIELEPDLIMTFSVGDPQFDSHPALLDAGLKTILSGSYMESTPLGRAEWIKFTGAFFNAEAAATTAYTDIAERYNQISSLAQAADDRPTVLINAPFQGTWYISGGQSYLARLLADAGADYLWADDDSTGGMALSFEAVFEQAQDADYWLNPSGWQSLADGLAEDERYAEFAAFENGNVYNNNARVNANGGNDYFESGVTNPDVVLADLIKIFHPELVPDHEFYFYQQLQP